MSKIERAREAICEIYGNTEEPQSETKEKLEQLREYIDELITALEADDE